MTRSLLARAEAAMTDYLDDKCPCCGGEGFIFECFDGFCEDCDIGCDDCTRSRPACSRAASTAKRKIKQRLATPNLFPHLEHEDRAELDRADQAWERGDKMVKRGQARTEAIKGIVDADAGLKITAADLKPYDKPSRP